MIVPTIPYSCWLPLTVAEVAQRFAGAPFRWGLASGHTIEQFIGRPIRPRDDITIIVFLDQQLAVQRWLCDWHLFAADPPGTLRSWRDGKELRYGIHDIWGHE